MAKKKKRSGGPRLHRMNHGSRLQSARSWLATQTGRTPVQIGRAYRKRYGVDWPCAIRELTARGVKFDPDWIKQLMRSLEGHYRARAQRRAMNAQRNVQEAESESNEYFAYIAGYTEGGTPFGVTWEEWDPIKQSQAPTPPEPDPF